jgi:hypothetical protein
MIEPKKTDLSILTALHGAFAVCENQLWMLGGVEPGDKLLAAEVVGELVQFVRIYGESKAEALFNVASHVARTSPARVTLPAWEELPPAIQYAFDIFSSVLRRIDADKDMATRRAQFLEDLKKPPPPHDIEGTPLEQTPSLFDPMR